MNTLPRAIEGLLRRGAPVVETTKGTANYGERGTVIAFPAGLRVAWASSMITSITHGSDLDLDDPAGRDIVLRWAQDVHELDLDRLRDDPERLRAAALVLADHPEAPAAIRAAWIAWRALDKKWRTEWYNGTRALLSGDRLGFDLAAHHLHLSRPWKSAPEGWPDRIEAALAAMPERS
jgi:hypothetical protein